MPCWALVRMMMLASQPMMPPMIKARMRPMATLLFSPAANGGGSVY
jgi:hypothetical protein